MSATRDCLPPSQPGGAPPCQGQNRERSARTACLDALYPDQLPGSDGTEPPRPHRSSAPKGSTSRAVANRLGIPPARERFSIWSRPGGAGRWFAAAVSSIDLMSGAVVVVGEAGAVRIGQPTWNGRAAYFRRADRVTYTDRPARFKRAGRALWPPLPEVDCVAPAVSSEFSSALPPRTRTAAAAQHAGTVPWTKPPAAWPTNTFFRLAALFNQPGGCRAQSSPTCRSKQATGFINQLSGDDLIVVASVSSTVLRARAARPPGRARMQC